MGKDNFDYEVIKPDQSEINIKKNYDIGGKFIWNTSIYKYQYLGIKSITQGEIEEILDAIKKLNKKSILPKWLKWGKKE